MFNDNLAKYLELANYWGLSKDDIEEDISQYNGHIDDTYCWYLSILVRVFDKVMCDMEEYYEYDDQSYNIVNKLRTEFTPYIGDDEIKFDNILDEINLMGEKEKTYQQIYHTK